MKPEVREVLEAASVIVMVLIAGWLLREFGSVLPPAAMAAIDVKTATTIGAGLGLFILAQKVMGLVIR